ncbi:MAG: transcription antitermination factor NusB [Proteobacteria bacterium]|nr:MAG: transcription antitermination factor NusB [Pseudomonadota bacterium]QKK11571.1 MAG: transcription antitermination factor NusB [Pseudomonadota bacterium]
MSRKRTWSRRCAAQAIYQWQVTGETPGNLQATFPADQDMAQADADYFEELFRGVVGQVQELDEHLAPLLDRKVAELDPVERAILRLGAYELVAHPEVPYRVVINEAIELAKRFGADQGHKYVNSVLDKVAQHVRAVEVRGPAA